MFNKNIKLIIAAGILGYAVYQFTESYIGNGIDAYYGFEFNNAPVVGDEVAFMFDDAFNGAIASAGETEATAIAYSGEVESHYAILEATIQSDREGWQNQLDAISYSAETEEKNIIEQESI